MYTWPPVGMTISSPQLLQLTSVEALLKTMTLSLHLLHSISKNLLLGLGTFAFIFFSPISISLLFQLKLLRAEARTLPMLFSAHTALEPQIYASGRLFSAFRVFLWKRVISLHLSQEAALALCNFSPALPFGVFGRMLRMLPAVRAVNAQFFRIFHSNLPLMYQPPLIYLV